jgi:hypothetical protein
LTWALGWLKLPVKVGLVGSFSKGVMICLRGCLVGKESKSVIVTVADAALGEIQSLANLLKEHGMRVSRVMPVTGVISGSVAASKLGKLRGVPGVSSVEEELNAYPTKK